MALIVLALIEEMDDAPTIGLIVLLIIWPATWLMIIGAMFARQRGLLQYSSDHEWEIEVSPGIWEAGGPFDEPSESAR
jgi:hypothetical protein